MLVKGGVISFECLAQICFLKDLIDEGKRERGHL